jgi:hypothetical protein
MKKSSTSSERLILSKRDSQALSEAARVRFSPNQSLKEALDTAKLVKRK